MYILFIFAFLSGLVTIAAPCIWPLLPIILSSSSTGGKQKPLGITLGIMISFAVFTLTISYIVSLIPFDPTILRYFAVIIIGFLGLTLIIPKLSQLVEGYVSRLSGKFGRVNTQDNGFKGGLITGLSLGIVWTPCAGPILATIATLAATQKVNAAIILITVVYVIGVGIPLFLFATLGQHIFTKSRLLNKYTGRIQQIFGVIMILTALSIVTNYDKFLQAKLLDTFPSYSIFLTNLESNETVKKELNALKDNENFMKPLMQTDKKNTAPEFTGINNWLNTDKPLTMKELKGKVVLIDFWTYTCINCIRTFPYVTSWYEKYKDQGFVVVGVHTPEFEFEKQTENVQQAIKQYNLTYPVAQDNDFATWNAYNNMYWPAHYLIDAEGTIRYVHFGEGEYDKTEKMIQELLKEAGKTTDTTTVNVNAEKNMGAATPETYLGLSRMEYNTNTIFTRGEQELNMSNSLQLNSFSYGGTWNIQSEYAESVKNSVLNIRFKAKKVFLVITPKQKNDRIKLLLDGKPYKELILDEPRLYELFDTKGSVEEHILELRFENEGTQVFAFTFG